MSRIVDTSLGISCFIVFILQIDQSKIKENNNVSFDTDSPFNLYSLSSQSQFRIKSFCHYDPSSVNTSDYSIFQLEIVDSDLQRYYQGRFILEIWSKSGDKIFSKVLNNECTQWNLYNNVFVYKENTFSNIIFILWLNDKKMVAFKHPFEDNKEVDMIYYDGSLIVTSNKNFKCIPISANEVSTTIQSFQGEDNIPPIDKKDVMTVAANDQVISLIPNPNQHELIFVCQNEQKAITFYRFMQQVINQKRQYILQIIQDQSGKKPKMDKRILQLMMKSQEILQTMVYSRNGITYVLILRQDYILQVIENFGPTIYSEQVQKLQKILPWFNETITFQFEDGSITQANNFDKLGDRHPISEVEYYRLHNSPPEKTTLGEIHKNVHYFQDSIVVNQTVFLLRENVIFIIDTLKEEVVNKFFTKGKLIGLYKLKQSHEDENGFKSTSYKVIALNKNGTIQVFQPNDTYLMQDWVKHDISQTPMLQAKDLLITGFQNQNSLSNLYITSLSQQGDQKLYQMMYNSQIIEVNIRLMKNDMVFCVNYTTRNREMIGVIDHKNLTIFKNEKGNITKMFQINILANEIKDFITARSSIFFFHREFLLILCNERVFKISTKTSQVDMLRLRDPVQAHLGNCFLDTQYFYFVVRGEEDQAFKVAVLGIDMVEAAYNESSRDQQNAISIEKKGGSSIQLYYPDWGIPKTIRKLDYDEFNGSFSMLLATSEVINFPLLHRNTFQFQNMAERTFYLAFRKTKEFFYALDRSNHINCWSRLSGNLLHRTFLEGQDYRSFEVDRGVYDKDWFKFSLIYSRVPENKGGQDDNILSTTVKQYLFKIIEINNQGEVKEIMQFEHSTKNVNETHFYFNNDFTQMVELLTNKQKKFARATYNLYTLNSNADSRSKWHFEYVLNNSDSFTEWHHKTLYPYNMTFDHLIPFESKNYNPAPEDLYKILPQNKVKVLNLKDGIEMILDLESGQIENFLALMYSFQTTQESFYDKRCGQQFIQDITERLQNYYENIRRKIFLEDKKVPKIRSTDVSARNFKQKYMIEQSFTFLDFRFFKQFIEDSSDSLIKIFKTMSEDHLKRLVHNFFPGKNTTIMHFIAQNPQGFECVDYFQQLSKRAGFVVPFLIDNDGNTPLDFAMKNRDHKQTNSLVKLLSKAPMDHHSRLITHLMPKLIDMAVPALDKYFDKRKYQTGICKTLTIAKVNIQEDKEFKAISSTLANENTAEILSVLTNEKFKEQSVQLEVLDLPMSGMKESKNDGSQGANEYEINMIKSLANCENINVFSQKTVRAFIDYIWPKCRFIIGMELFFPYMAFILYYMIFLVVIKKLSIAEEQDPTFYSYASEIFYVFTFMIKMILFIFSFYFFQHDLKQIRSFSSNKIILWTYANILPLLLMIFVTIFDTFFTDLSTTIEKMFYSASAFFIWIRVLHLLKCYTQTSYLLRMGTQILFRMRYLISFIIVSLLAFGFTFFFLGPDEVGPFEGISTMFLVLVGHYDSSMFSTVYLELLFVLACCFNFFFIFTLLIALSVVAFTNESDVYSNEAYQDKVQMMALYSYLLRSKNIRDPSKKYLLIATVTDNRTAKRNDKQGGFNQQSTGGGASKDQMKLMKTFDRKIASMTQKLDKQMKDINDRLDNMMETQNKIVQYSRPSPQKK